MHLLAEAYLHDLDPFVVRFTGDFGLRWYGLAYAAGFVSNDYRAELESIAERIDRSLEEVLLANLYYDAIFAVIGCTAFAIDTPQGPLHARNLDWWTEKNQLAKHTCEIRYRGGPTPTRVAGWPGFMGVFSGVAEGRFAITLNAVVSAGGEGRLGN